MKIQVDYYELQWIAVNYYEFVFINSRMSLGGVWGGVGSGGDQDAGVIHNNS